MVPASLLCSHVDCQRNDVKEAYQSSSLSICERTERGQRKVTRKRNSRLIRSSLGCITPAKIRGSLLPPTTQSTHVLDITVLYGQVTSSCQRCCCYPRKGFVVSSNKSTTRYLIIKAAPVFTAVSSLDGSILFLPIDIQHPCCWCAAATTTTSSANFHVPDRSTTTQYRIGRRFKIRSQVDGNT